MTRQPHRATPRALRLATLGLAGALVAVAACTPGQYPLDTMPEMHYQESQRRLEPERRSPPEGAVPVGGARPDYTFVQASTLESPLTPDSQTLARGAQVYATNCTVCHGVRGRGDGPVAAYYAHSPATTLPPTDLTGARVRARTDGELYWILTYGLGNMPPYRDLLTQTDTWAVVHFIRSLGG